MPAPFPYPAFNDTLQVFQYVNRDLMEGYLGIGVLISLWIILFVRLKVYHNNPKAFAGSSFFLALVGILLWAVGLVNDLGLIVVIMMAVVAGVMLKSSEGAFE